MMKLVASILILSAAVMAIEQNGDHLILPEYTRNPDTMQPYDAVRVQGIDVDPSGNVIYITGYGADGIHELNYFRDKDLATWRIDWDMRDEYYCEWDCFYNHAYNTIDPFPEDNETPRSPDDGYDAIYLEDCGRMISIGFAAGEGWTWDDGLIHPNVAYMAFDPSGSYENFLYEETGGVYWSLSEPLPDDNAPWGAADIGGGLFAVGGWVRSWPSGSSTPRHTGYVDLCMCDPNMRPNVSHLDRFYFPAFQGYDDSVVSLVTSDPYDPSYLLCQGLTPSGSGSLDSGTNYFSLWLLEINSQNELVLAPGSIINEGYVGSEGCLTPLGQYNGSTYYLSAFNHDHVVYLALVKRYGASISIVSWCDIPSTTYWTDISAFDACRVMSGVTGEDDMLLFTTAINDNILPHNYCVIPYFIDIDWPYMDEPAISAVTATTEDGFCIEDYRDRETGYREAGFIYNGSSPYPDECYVAGTIAVPSGGVIDNQQIGIFKLEGLQSCQPASDRSSEDCSESLPSPALRLLSSSPSHGSVTVSAAGFSCAVDLEVLDLAGRRVFSQPGGDPSSLVWTGMSNGVPVPAGVYIIKVTDPDTGRFAATSFLHL